MSTKKPLKLPKVSKKKLEPPETEEEFLDAGVKEEEGGEKWRAGDAEKSTRFFLRSIEIYAAGLKRYPRSFDLAYNKARLQFDLSQQPRLVPHQPYPLIELLFTALESHKYALALQAENADVLFNTGQVLVSIAELLVDSSVPVGTHARADATPLLIEAINIFQKCLDIQWRHFREAESMVMHAQQQPVSSESDLTPPPQTSAESGVEDQWASVEEPVTFTTLLDTCLAEINAWITIVPLLDSGKATYTQTESDALKALERATSLVNTSEGEIAYQQATFNIKVALADYAYKSGLLSSSDYAKAVSDVWSSLSAIHAFGPALCDYADALITLSVTLSSDSTPVVLDVRWQALSTALKFLAQANTNPGSADRVAINARRGDVELLRTRMADPPTSFEQADKNKVLLVKNAETYYEGARKLAIAQGDTVTVDTMLAKTLIVRALREGSINQVLAGLSNTDQSKVQSVIDEMVEEGLIVS